MSNHKLPFMQFYPGDYIRDTRALSAEAKGVWMDALCFMWDAKERGVLRNTMDGFARMFGVTVDAFDAVLMQFDVNTICDVTRESSGVVTLMSRRMTKEEGTRSGNRWRKVKQREEERKRAEEERKAAEESRGCHAVVTGHISEVIYQKSENTPLPPGGESTPKGFARFWAAYPKKVGKAAALRSWKRYRCEAMADEVVASVAAHLGSEDWRKDGGQFIPHPATFLNQGRWEDELGVAASVPAAARGLPGSGRPARFEGI
jgi:uncharacterized protein YdaU (DUF1376 family)